MLTKILVFIQEKLNPDRMAEIAVDWSWPILVVALILLGAWMVVRLINQGLNRFTRLWHGERKQTLETLLRSICKYTVYGIAILLALEQMGIDIKAILAGIGIVGLAIGVGAQSLVKDVISGFFIIVEDQFNVGDYVNINGQMVGTIEELGLRTTTLREWSMKKYYIPNGQIHTVLNYNREKLRNIETVTVHYEEDIDKVRKVLNDICVELLHLYPEHFIQQDGQFEEPPQIHGISNIEQMGVQFTLVALSRPDSYFLMGREMRRLIVERFKEHDIRIAYPTRVLKGSERDVDEVICGC